MDPLADALSCDCVPGHAQRRYAKLCAFLAGRLGRAVEFLHAEDLADALGVVAGQVDLVIGQRSLVEFDAAETGTCVEPIAVLTGKDGRTGLSGLFVVRAADGARKIEDLEGRRILFGPPATAECRAAAVAALKAHSADAAGPLQTRDSINTAALAVIEGETDAAVLPEYSIALLEGCNVIEAGSLRVIGRTAAVPFVTVFATPRLGPAGRADVLRALQAVRGNRELLEAMESRDGFVKVASPRGADARLPATSAWADWRGPRRDAVSPDVPDTLPDKAAFLWRRPMSGWALAGVAATTRYVVVADKVEEETDVWRCLNADTGKPIWTVSYPAAGEMDYTNSPRATPVISQGLVYLLGAYGDLHCVTLARGRGVWKRNIVKDFRAEPPQWGACVSPLIVGDKLIVNPGARDASLVALDRWTGRELWRAPGPPAAYAGFIHGRFGGVEQIVGYDAVSLGGWDAASGKRLWQMLPPEEGDYNVPTPVAVGGRVLVATENNGTRVYRFKSRGALDPTPVATDSNLAPDTSTPVVVGGLVFGCSRKLLCLDLADGLRTRWQGADDAYRDYAALIGGNGRVLVADVAGRLLLVRASAEKYEVISRLKLFDYEAEAWSHPALVGDRFYVRSQKELCCLLLGPAGR